MKRNDIEICADLLNLAKGVNKTALVYGANLNFKIIKNYIVRLKKGGLLTETNRRYFATQKGVIFAQTAKDLRGLLQ